MKKRLLALLMISIVLLTACGTTSETQNSPGASEKDNIESGASSSASDDKKNSGVDHTVSAVSIKFDYQVMPNEASNQVAAWVENEKGKLVKTIYVSDFTGKRRGYKVREDALSHWVSAADPDSMSDKQIDAVSSATLQDGKQTFEWDLTNNNGETVPAGQYTIKLEGTLYWKSNVVYSGVVDTAKNTSGKITVRRKRSEPENSDNDTMIQNVKMSVK